MSLSGTGRDDCVCVCVAQDVKAGTIPADPLMQALLDHYLKRLSVNRTTLQALFKAADSDGHGVLDRPQARAALTLAQPDLIDTAITTIWLEQEKVIVAMSSAGFSTHFMPVVNRYSPVHHFTKRMFLMPRHTWSELFIAFWHSQTCLSDLLHPTTTRKDLWWRSRCQLTIWVGECLVIMAVMAAHL